VNVCAMIATSGSGRMRVSFGIGSVLGSFEC